MLRGLLSNVFTTLDNVDAIDFKSIADIYVSPKKGILVKVTAKRTKTRTRKLYGMDLSAYPKTIRNFIGRMLQAKVLSNTFNDHVKMLSQTHIEFRQVAKSQGQSFRKAAEAMIELYYARKVIDIKELCYIYFLGLAWNNYVLDNIGDTRRETKKLTQEAMREAPEIADAVAGIKEKRTRSEVINYLVKCARIGSTMIEISAVLQIGLHVLYPYLTKRQWESLSNVDDDMGASMVIEVIITNVTNPHIKEFFQNMYTINDRLNNEIAKALTLKGLTHDWSKGASYYAALVTHINFRRARSNLSPIPKDYFSADTNPGPKPKPPGNQNPADNSNPGPIPPPVDRSQKVFDRPLPYIPPNNYPPLPPLPDPENLNLNFTQQRQQERETVDLSIPPPPVAGHKRQKGKQRQYDEDAKRYKTRIDDDDYNRIFDEDIEMESTGASDIGSNVPTPRPFADTDTPNTTPGGPSNDILGEGSYNRNNEGLDNNAYPNGLDFLGGEIDPFGKENGQTRIDLDL